MPIGRLASADLAATTATAVYTAPQGAQQVVTVSLCNRNSSSVTVRLALVDGGIDYLSNDDYIEYGPSIPANGVLERSLIGVGGGQSLVAYASGTGVSAVVWGTL